MDTSNEKYYMMASASDKPIRLQTQGLKHTREDTNVDTESKRYFT